MSSENHEMTELVLNLNLLKWFSITNLKQSIKKLISNLGNLLLYIIYSLLKNNIAEMQGQIQKGYIRIKELVEEKDKLQEENDNLKKQLGT